MERLREGAQQALMSEALRVRRLSWETVKTEKDDGDGSSMMKVQHQQRSVIDCPILSFLHF